jgi:hypothetical protein
MLDGTSAAAAEMRTGGLFMEGGPGQPGQRARATGTRRLGKNPVSGQGADDAQRLSVI